jgi:hypothetical protein
MRRRGLRHEVHDAGGQFVGVGQQLTHLPPLVVAQRGAVSGHARQPDAIGSLPIRLADGVVGHALALKQGWGGGNIPLAVAVWGSSAVPWQTAQYSR